MVDTKHLEATYQEGLTMAMLTYLRLWPRSTARTYPER